MKRFRILIILSAVLLLQSCMAENPYHGQAQLPTSPSTTIGGNGTADNPPTVSYRSALAQELEHYLSTSDPFYQRVINKSVNEFGDMSTTPSNLVTLDPRIVRDGEKMELEARTAYAVRAMLAEMEADGIVGVEVTSGYRSVSYQRTLLNIYLEREMNSFTEDAYACLGAGYIEEHYDLEVDVGLNLVDAGRVVLSYSAPAGMSEHHTGLCVDLITKNMERLTNAFANTEAFTWLSQNAHRFGFILRYPSDKTDLTGYAYESWHYRYVGRDAATAIYTSGQTLEQYRTIAE